MGEGGSTLRLPVASLRHKFQVLAAKWSEQLSVNQQFTTALDESSCSIKSWWDSVVTLIREGLSEEQDQQIFI